MGFFFSVSHFYLGSDWSRLILSLQVYLLINVKHSILIIKKLISLRKYICTFSLEFLFSSVGPLSNFKVDYFKEDGERPYWWEFYYSEFLS